MDIYLTLYKAYTRADKNKKDVDVLSFIDKSPPDKIHTKFCKFFLGLKKCASNIASRAELGRYPIDTFIKTQSLSYEDRIHNSDSPHLLKECFSLSKSLHEQGTYSWYTYITHLKEQINLENNYEQNMMPDPKKYSKSAHKKNKK